MLGQNASLGPNGHNAAQNSNGALPSSTGEMAGEGEKEISLKDVFGVLFKNKWGILACFALVLALAATYTALVAPKYQSSSKVLIRDQAASAQLSDILSMQPGQRSNVANEVEILKSRAIAERVAAELIDQRYVPGTQKLLPVMQTEPETELTPRMVAGRLMERVVIDPVSRQTDLIDINATSTSPEEAQLIADLYAREYRKYDRAISSRRARESREFLEGAVDSFQVNLQQQENELQSFLKNQQVVAPDQEAEQLLSRISTLREQRFEAQLERGKARTRLSKLQAKLDSIQPGLARAITNNDAMQYKALQEQITKLQTELENYYANNPELRSDPDDEAQRLKRKIANLKDQVGERAKSLTRDAVAGTGIGVGGEQGGKLARVQELSERVLQNKLDLQAAKAGVQAADRALGTYRSRLEDLPQQKIVLNRLQRSLSTSSSVYKNLRKKLYDARIAEQSELGKVQIVDEALVPKKPVRPNIPLNLALGSLLGVVLGVGVAFTRNMLDNKVRSPDDLRQMGHSVLGTVPDMQPVVNSDFGGRDYIDVEGRKYSTRLIALLNPLSPISESYRHLRTNLQFSHPDSDVRVVLVTSAGPGEGKSITSANLAVTMAQSGRRTLYLDADLRRATGHKTFGIAREPGLVDLLFEPYATVGDRFATEVENLHVLPTGSSVPNPAEVLGSEKMKELIEQLRGDFDFIVIDTSPVMAVTDPLLVSKHCDAVVTVHAANQTEQHAVERAAETLQRVDTQPAGVVLNRFDPKAAYGSYGYGYGYGYGAYGGAGEPEPEQAPPASA